MNIETERVIFKNETGLITHQIKMTKIIKSKRNESKNSNIKEICVSFYYLLSNINAL